MRSIKTFAIAIVAASALLVTASAANAEIMHANEVEARIGGIPQSGRTLGSAQAPLTMTYFHDLKCPFCHEFTTEILPTVIRRYVRSGKLRLVAQPVAFVGVDGGADSRRAAAAAIALGAQGKYWNFSDLFYANQRDEATTYVSDSYLTELANAIPGADAQPMLSQMSSRKVAKSLKNSRALFDRLEFFGVPTVLLTPTGRRVRRADEVERSLRDLTRAIRRNLRRLERRG